MGSKYIPNKKNRKPKGAFVNSVLDVFASRPDKSLNYKQISNILKITSANSRKIVIQTIHQLETSKTITEVERGKYKLTVSPKSVTGIIDFTTSGSAFVTVEGWDKDIFIHNKSTHTALDKDEVELRITKHVKGKRPEGKVIKVLQRSKMEFVGTIEISSKYAFFIPDDRRISVDFFVALQDVNKARDGEKVLVKITQWDDPKNSPYAKVLEVLGMPGETNVEMLSILASKGFTTVFPKIVTREAEAISLTISEEEIKNRKDFRETLTFTIDPVDAKDFDDAISFKKLNDNLFEIGVHIADVTHYIKPNSALDQEAINRATSVYLTDRVIPMLPERLSNGVCSLRPNEDKLCFSTVFKMDKSGKILDTWIGRTVIHSNQRFTYEDVQEIIEKEEGLYVEELLTVNSIAKIMREKRMKSGSISFDRVEIRFQLNENKEPVGVFFKSQKEAHKLIEEFMLQANKSVALYVAGLKQKVKPFVYRIHDEPNPTKIAAFGLFIKRFGYKLNEDKLQASLNDVLAEVKGKGEANVVETLAIRTMAKAEYSTYNVGHYGLGFSHYSHFTSPIRRYPDVLAHRLLWKYLNNEPVPDQDELEQLCKHASAQERAATEAERESSKYYQALFLNDRVGEIFEGVISGVSDFGIFVEIIENGCEGLIRLANISGDYFYFDETNYAVVGNNTGRAYQLGQHINIKVQNVDLSKKQMDFELVES